MKNKTEVEKAFEILMANAETDLEKHWIENLRKDLKSPPRVEVLEFGYQSFLGGNYRAVKTGHFYAVAQIHRVVWNYYYGEIPEGYHIHHKDFNPANNNIENLEMLTLAEHAKRHLKNTLQKPLGNKMVECPVCGKIFEVPKHGWHVYCSIKCRDKARNSRKRTTKICAFCQKEFQGLPNQRFCSQSCGSKAANLSKPKPPTKIIRQCVVCGKDFETARLSSTRTCSRSCANKWRWQKFKALNPEPERICPYCGKPVTSRHKENIFCSRTCATRYRLKQKKQSQTQP